MQTQPGSRIKLPMGLAIRPTLSLVSPQGWIPKPQCKAWAVLGISGVLDRGNHEMTAKGGVSPERAKTKD